MREKIYQFRINHPLTAAKRKAIDRYIFSNAHLAPSKVAHTWEGKRHELLNLSTPPIRWEIAFHDHLVEIHADGPLWAYLLFTEEKKQALHHQIERLLQNTGFLHAKRNSPRTRKPSRVRVNRNSAKE